MKKILFVFVAVVIVVLVFVIYSNSNSDFDKNPKPANTIDSAKTSTPTASAAYQDYSREAVLREQNESNKVVLFFYAPWCPFCRAADSEFRSNFSEIPSGVVVFKTDYDSNSDLKQKYGITYQHTFVQIDNNGSIVSKWSGGDIDNLKKYLR